MLLCSCLRLCLDQPLSRGKMSSSGSVVGDDDAQERVPKRTLAPQRKRDAVLAGPLQLVIVVGCAAGGLHDNFTDAVLSASWTAGGGALVLGILLLSSWTLARADSKPTNKGHQYMRGMCRRMTRGAALGYVDYPVEGWARLKDPLVALSTSAPAVLRQIAEQPVAEWSGGSPGICVRDLVKRWQTSSGAKAALLVRVGMHAAHQVLTGAWTCLHSVAITQRTDRKRLLDRTVPSRRTLARFTQDAGKAVPHIDDGEQVAAPRINAGWKYGIYDPALVIEWLEASAFVRDINRIGEAAESFARIFARAAGTCSTKLLSNIRTIHTEVLRKSRVRMDLVAMLMFRRFWSSLVGTVGHERLSIYLYADASPQWRGLELYASSFEVFDGKVYQRRLLPMISLDRSFQDAAGKCLALLWQVFLVVGPSFEMVRLFCSRVRSITTDQGVERLLVDYPAFLGKFFALVDPAYKPPDDMDDSTWLFPQAVAIPGWMHLWDLEIRRGLSGLRFFPKWVRGLKALVSFLRNSQHTTLITRGLRKKGMHGAADLIKKLSLPNFAEWRWGTLLGCCNALSGVLATLAANFDASLFQSARERTGLSDMLAALSSPAWHSQFQFVHWFCRWLGGIMSWGRGCACHSEELRQGQQIDCPLKGRRLREAYAFATAELQKGLSEANSWGPEDWQFEDNDSWLDCQACVRSVFEMATRKLSFLDRVPYLLSRLGEPGVRRRCEEQWSSCPPEKHHRVTRQFFEGPLVGDIKAIQKDGSGVSARLQREIDSLAAVPLDDSVAEGPHSSAARVVRHSRNSRWPWVASTMRLAQNLRDAHTIPDVIGTTAVDLWPKYTAVLHGPSARRQGPKKLPWVKLQDDVYKMSFVVERASEASKAESVSTPASSGDGTGSGQHCLDEDASDEEGGASNTKPTPVGEETRGSARPSTSRKRQRTAKSVSTGVAASGSAGGQQPTAVIVGKGEVVADGSLGFRKKNSDDVRLMRQFLGGSLCAKSFISVPVQSETGFVSHQVFQILSLESKPVIVKSFSTLEEDAAEQGLYVVAVQPMERWAAREDTLSTSSSPQQVFIYQDPCSVDILLLCDGVEHRREWLSWTARPSDVDGCVELHSPTMLQPSFPLHSPKIPVLCLLDALHEKGYQGSSKTVVHKRDGPLAYDCRNLVGKRFYLQCVLAAPELLNTEGSFPSGQPASFYQLMLKTKQVPDLKGGSKSYRLRLAELEGDDVEIAALRRALAAPAIAPNTEKASGSKDKTRKQVDSDSVVGDDDIEEAAELQGADASGDDGSVAGDDDVGQGSQLVAPKVGGQGFPELLLGQRLRAVKGRRDQTWSYGPRLSVACRNPQHRQCTKSRSIELGAAEHGRLAAVYFLGAWLEKSHTMSGAEHKRYAPSSAAIKAFAQSYEAM